MKEGEKRKSREENIYIGKKIKKLNEENPTNDNSFPEKSEKYSEKSLKSENSENKSIYVNSLNRIKETQLENIFKSYGKINEIIINKNSGIVTFSKKKSAQAIIDDKSKIYSEYKLKVGYKDNEFDNIEEKENEPINIEEYEPEDDIIITEKKTKPKKSKKKKDERKSKESNNKSDNSLEISDDKTNIKNEFSEKLLSLEKTINEIIQNDNMLSNKIKNLETQNKKMLKLIGVIGETNIQNEKYITNVDFKFELVSNSYKILYIRKLANIILNELYTKYNNHFKNIRISTNSNKHVFTVCIKNIKGIDKDIITLIIDFLKYIKFRISQIIHIQDKDIKFNREILSEYINTSTSINEDSFPLKEASTLIFQNVNKKEKTLSKERKESYKRLKILIKEQIEQYRDDEEEEEEQEDSENENSEEIEENEEKRIENILKGDKTSINMNMKFQLNQLLKIYKKNQLEADNQFKEIIKIDGIFLYNEWMNSFSKEEFKADDLFLQYVHINKSPSLENMGFCVNEILDNLRINFNDEDPNKLEEKIKTKFVKKNKKKLRK